VKLSVLIVATSAALVAAVCGTFLAFHRPKVGRMPFTIWRMISSDAHGGQFTTVNDVRIYFETYGSGAPVLVLHGGMGSLENMAYQIRALAATRFVFAPDSRGHGRSSDSDSPLSYALMTEDMVKLMDHLHIQRTDVVGWSDGGIVALDLAIRYPERIRRIVVIGSNFGVDGLIDPPVPGGAIPPVPRYYSRIAADPTHWPVLFRKVTMMWATQPHYSREQLGRINAPTLVMAGESDIVKREHTDALARAIPKSKESIVGGTTHNLIWEKSEIVNAEILQFLDKTDPP
jgi:pimeloyl-ACP methyl ester carboxylesterase